MDFLYAWFDFYSKVKLNYFVFELGYDDTLSDFIVKTSCHHQDLLPLIIPSIAASKLTTKLKAELTKHD